MRLTIDLYSVLAPEPSDSEAVIEAESTNIPISEIESTPVDPDSGVTTKVVDGEVEEEAVVPNMVKQPFKGRDATLYSPILHLSNCTYYDGGGKSSHSLQHLLHHP